MRCHARIAASDTRTRRRPARTSSWPSASRDAKSKAAPVVEMQQNRHGERDGAAATGLLRCINDAVHVHVEQRRPRHEAASRQRTELMTANAGRRHCDASQRARYGPAEVQPCISNAREGLGRSACCEQPTDEAARHCWHQLDRRESTTKRDFRVRNRLWPYVTGTSGARRADEVVPAHFELVRFGTSSGPGPVRTTLGQVG